MILGLELAAVFTVVYLALGIPLLLVELYGAFVRRKRGGDTISEHWWWLRNRHPWLNWVMGGFLIWLSYHFLFDGWLR
jgi:hypothetical protein